MDMTFDGFQSITFNENHIKQLHGVLLKYSSKDEEHRGQYKKVPNDVQAFGPDGKSLGVVFETATPFETPGWMTELVDWFNRSIEEDTQHSLILIGIFIVVFLAIHPFKDGKRPTLPNIDYVTAAARGLWLCSVQFDGERRRMQ